MGIRCWLFLIPESVLSEVRMMKLFVLTLVLAAAYAVPTPGPYSGHKLLAITPVTEEQVAWLEKLRENDANVDFWSEPRVNTDVHVRVTPEAYAELTKLMGVMGLHYEVKLENLQTLIDLEASRPVSFSGSAVGRYAMSEEIFALVKQLAADHP